MNKIKSLAQGAARQALTGAPPPDSGRNPLRVRDLGLDEAVTPLAV